MSAEQSFLGKAETTYSQYIEMVHVIQHTIGALKVHRHWKDTMPEALADLLNEALPPEERVCFGSRRVRDYGAVNPTEERE